MRQYLRPLGLLSRTVAIRAVDTGAALPLAGGPIAFSLAEIITRAEGWTDRRLVHAADAADLLAAHTAPRQNPLGRSSPIVMGIVNATPDSFFDGGLYFDPGKAIDQGLTLIAGGADIIDIGGESTRPGALAVEPEEEQRRVLPVIAGLRDLATRRQVPISVDTRNAATMRFACAAGATMINDVSALSHERESVAAAAETGATVVLMHMQGEPQTMQAAPTYDDVALDVYDYLESRIAACIAAGIPRSRIVADPGIGFGKTVAHNLALLDHLTVFHGLGVPLLIGASRKGFIGRLSAGNSAPDRLGGSLAAGLAAVSAGVQILRVHDVPETVQALRVIRAIAEV